SRLPLEAPMPAAGLVRLRTAVDGDVDAIRILRVGPFAIAEPAVAAADLDDFERLHDRVVEAFGGREVGNGDGDVVQHRLLHPIAIRHPEERALARVSRYDGP